MGIERKRFLYSLSGVFFLDCIVANTSIEDGIASKESDGIFSSIRGVSLQSTMANRAASE
jgi:hypothetical protein